MNRLSNDKVAVGKLATDQNPGLEMGGVPVTPTAAEMNVLHSSGLTNADLVKLHAVQSSATEVDRVAGNSGGTVAGGDGAIAVKQGTVFITKGSAAALTLADPTATTDDGKVLRVVSVTAFAHTLSNAAGSGFNAGGAASDVGTFGGARGDSITLIAYQGAWYVLAKTNVTLG